MLISRVCTKRAVRNVPPLRSIHVNRVWSRIVLVTGDRRYHLERSIVSAANVPLFRRQRRRRRARVPRRSTATARNPWKCRERCCLLIEFDAIFNSFYTLMLYVAQKEIPTRTEKSWLLSLTLVNDNRFFLLLRKQNTMYNG